ncbi:hypothetical protein [Actinospongicola halichondriae]|uniref:hypothetical protein n=1 Tax=Actinospongicola halichondriae TaxID=3236844 RepID=UPI003D4D8591
MSSSWAMPGASAPQPSRPVDVDTPSSTAASGPSAGAAPLPPPPVPLRPMTIPDLLDGSFDILKRRPRDVLILATVFVVPIQVLSAVLLRDVIGGGGFAGTGLGDTTSTLGFGESGELTGAGTLAATLVASMSSLALLTGAMTMLVHDWYAGVRRAPSVIVLATLRRAPALLVAVVVVHVLEVVGLVGLGIGAYIVMAFLQIVSPVVVAEHVGPFRALVRSTQLTGTRFWRSMGVPLLVGLLSTIVGFGFQLIPEVATLVVADDWNWLIRSAGSTFSELVVAPFTAGVAILYHLDLRSRSEGYDIQRRVQALIEP